MEMEGREMSLDGDFHLGCSSQRSFKENSSFNMAEGCSVRKGISATYLGHHEEKEIAENSPREGFHIQGGPFRRNVSNEEYNQMDANMTKHRNEQMVHANLEGGNCPRCVNLYSGSEQGELLKGFQKELDREKNIRRSNPTCEQAQWNGTNPKRDTQRSRSGLLAHEENCPYSKTLEIFHHLGEEGANQGDGHSSTSWNGTDYTNFENSDAEVDSCGNDEEDASQGVNFGTTLENISPSNNPAVHTVDSSLEHYGWRKGKKKKKRSYQEATDRESDQVLYNMANQKLTGTSVMLTGEKSKYIYKLVPFFKNGEAKFYMNAFAAYEQLHGQFRRALRGVSYGDERNRPDRLEELHTNMQSAMAYFYLMNEKTMSATRKKPPRSSPCKGTLEGDQGDDVKEHPPNWAAGSTSIPTASIPITSANTDGTHFKRDCVEDCPEVERPPCDNPQLEKSNSTLKSPRLGVGFTPEEEDNTNGGIRSSIHYAMHTPEEKKLVKLLGEHTYPVEEGQKQFPPSADLPAWVGSDIMSCHRLQGRSGHYKRNRNTSALGRHRVLAFLVKQKLIPKCYNIVPVYPCEGEDAASYLAETNKMSDESQSAGSTAENVPEARKTEPHVEEPLLNGRRHDVAVRSDMPGKEAEKWRVGKLSDLVNLNDLVKAAEGIRRENPPERTIHLALKLKKMCHTIDPRNQNVLDLKLGYNTLKDNDTQFSERLKEESDSIEWSEKEKYVKRWSRMKKDIRSRHLNTSDEHIIDLSARDMNLPPAFFNYDNHEIYCLLKSWKQEITARMTTQRRLGFRICALVCGVEQQDVLTDERVRDFYADCVEKYGPVVDGSSFSGNCENCGSQDYQHSGLCHSLQHTHLSQHNHPQRDGDAPPPSINHCYDSVHKKLQISRDVGLHLREEHVVYALTYFFKSIVSIVLPKLISLKVWLEEQQVYSFCSTSLLIIYDRRNPQTCDIKWIDFTYSFDNTVSPRRYEQMKHERHNLDILFGLNNLIKLCRTVFSDSEIPPSLSCPSSSEKKRSHPGIHDQS
ncbi:hypothetical protein C922_01290 [Plasmodium inui San Antonio 1]|uniref:Kinase n=1 Tax=Plasmodium inui San Antonio 1 TaxID=1237626 RepID=W7A9B0_9APIC|nr:hypothetical protein C922_01290 [Plasmodium inui San Antonio 1]EUD68270.1 hypothetical protein C922_01290 [Plasmodium inui San Antonio 1]